MQLSDASYQIELVCEQYNSSVDRLQKVIDACRKDYVFDDAQIQLVVSSTSEFYNDAYVQQIIIHFKIY
jgi:hypothetical protein